MTQISFGFQWRHREPRVIVFICNVDDQTSGSIATSVNYYFFSQNRAFHIKSTVCLVLEV